jgi:signal transduction histidine kinase
MAGMTVLMWALFSAVAATYNWSLLNSLRLRFENLMLGEKLERAHLVEVGDQAKTRFFATMSHELRTPLNAILGFSEILKSEMFGPVGSDQYRDYVGSINDSAQQLLRMIDEVLLLSGIEAGRVQLEDQKTDLEETVRTAVEGVRDTAEARGVHIVTHLADDCALMRADQFAVRQIVAKLLLSALDSVPDDGEVSVETSRDRIRRLVLEVAHSGTGPDPQEAADLDSPDLGSMVASKGRPFGFGLSVAKALVEMHGGSLDLASDKALRPVAAARFPAERAVNGCGAAKAPAADAVERDETESGDEARFG